MNHPKDSGRTLECRRAHVITHKQLYTVYTLHSFSLHGNLVTEDDFSFVYILKYVTFRYCNKAVFF